MSVVIKNVIKFYGCVVKSEKKENRNMGEKYTYITDYIIIYTTLFDAYYITCRFLLF